MTAGRRRMRAIAMTAGEKIASWDFRKIAGLPRQPPDQAGNAHG